MREEKRRGEERRETPQDEVLPMPMNVTAGFMKPQHTVKLSLKHTKTCTFANFTFQVKKCIVLDGKNCFLESKLSKLIYHVFKKIKK